MFAMYDDDGLNFRSTIDHLYDVHEISKSHLIKNDLRDKNNKKFDDVYKGEINEEAKNKYKQMANLDTRAEIFHVEQIMSHKPFIVNEPITINECYEMMQENKVQQLLIRADNQKNHLKGIISLQEILHYIMNTGGNVLEIVNRPVSEISTKNIITTDPISDIRRVAKVMIDFNINAIPVVDSEDNILGVVSRRDIVEAVSSIPHLQIWA